MTDRHNYFFFFFGSIEVHEVDPDLFIVTNIQNYSEKDLDIKLWGRVFIFLFSDYKFIKIKGYVPHNLTVQNRH